MQHIRKFNENTNDHSEFIEEVHECFIELLEEGFEIITDLGEMSNENVCIINFDDMPTWEASITSAGDYHRKLASIHDEIKYCMDKLMSKYPKLEYALMEEEEVGIEIIIISYL